MPYDEYDLEEFDDQLAGDFEEGEFDFENGDAFEDYEDTEDDIEGFDLEELEAMAEEAMDDPAVADEFFPAIAGLAGGLLGKLGAGKLISKVVPKIFKFGKRLFRGRKRRAVRRLPRAVVKLTRRIAARPGPYMARPSRVSQCLRRCICGRPIPSPRRRRRMIA